MFEIDKQAWENRGMSRSASTGSVEGGWDGPWYRVRTEAFEASFLPSSPDEDLDVVCNVDAEVQLLGRVLGRDQAAVLARSLIQIIAPRSWMPAR